jgi:hypothetical protein
MDEFDGTLRMTCDVPNLIHTASVVRTNSQINSFSDYVITFTTTNEIKQGGYFIIKIPKESIVISSQESLSLKVTVGAQDLQWNFSSFSSTDPQFYTLTVPQWCSNINSGPEDCLEN